MARKSRKTTNTPVAVPIVKPLFHAAIYARLSAEDKDALSLENQILMARNYIKDCSELAFAGEFSDNGLTGTNFQRPGFESLMDEVRSGRVNCIVVKDLSRFGRDYVEAGNLLEVIFPKLGVRFISIGDNYDSFDPRCNGDGMSVALKNMINAFYAKDISKKIRSAYASKQRKGEYSGNYAPFGYLKSQTEKGKLVIDEEAAAVVRNIFRWRLDGLNPSQIVKKLNDSDIPSPLNYFYLKGIYFGRNNDRHIYWLSNTVRHILENMVYVGHMALGKQRVHPNVMHNEIRQPKENWIITYNTHEAIISQSDFDAVQELVKQSKQKHWKYAENSNHAMSETENIFSGITFCADCGRAYTRQITCSKDRTKHYFRYICSYCKIHRPDKAQIKYMGEQDLMDVILSSITKQISLCADARHIIEKIRRSSPVVQKKCGMADETQKLHQELERLPVRRLNLHNDYCDGILTAEDYKQFSNRYEADEQKLRKRLSELSKEQARLEPRFVDENAYIMAFERFQNAQTLTKEMLLALVERIEVSSDSEVKIRFRFMDDFACLGELITENGEQLPADKMERAVMTA